MKQLACALLLILASCGGGAVPPSSGSDPAADDPNGSLLVESLLQSCSDDPIAETLDVQEWLLGLLGGGDVANRFSITGVNLLQASFTWALDLDGDASPEFNGSTQFLDAQGAPSIPVSDVQDLLDALQGDLTALGRVLAGATAGTQVRTTYTGVPSDLPETTIEGDITIVFGATGVPTQSSGWQTSSTDALCSSEIRWTDLELGAADAAQPPSGTLEFDVFGASGSLEGTLLLDGDDTAVLEVSVDGAAPVTYTYDLGTGTVS